MIAPPSRAVCGTWRATASRAARGAGLDSGSRTAPANALAPHKYLWRAAGTTMNAIASDPVWTEDLEFNTQVGKQDIMSGPAGCCKHPSQGFDKGRIRARVLPSAEHLGGGEQPDQRHNDGHLVHKHHIVLSSPPAARQLPRNHALCRLEEYRLDAAYENRWWAQPSSTTNSLEAPQAVERQWE